MTVAIHGYPKFKFFLPGTNTLAVGAQLFTYEVGTTTKKSSYPTFADGEAGTNANANPMVLNADAEVPNDLWLDGKYKLVLAPSNDTDPPASAYWTIDSVGDEDLTASLAGVANKIPNGSFEVDTTGNGVPDNWSFTAGTGNTLAIDTTDQWHGDTSLKFTIASANTAVAESDFFEVQEAQEEVIRFNIKASAVDANVIVRLVWYTAAQVFISNTDVYSDSSANPTSWTDKGIYFTPVSTARFAKLQVRVATTGKTVRVDNFRTQVLEGANISTAITGVWSFDNGITQFGSNAPERAWNLGDVLEINSSSALAATSTTVYLTEGAYYDGAWKRAGAEPASIFQAGGGDAYFRTINSGAADSTFTWQNNIRAVSDGTVRGLAGNWLISTDGTDITPQQELVLYKGTGTNVYQQFANSTTGSAGGDGFLVGLDASERAVIHNQENTDLMLYTNSSLRGKIAAGGNWLISTDGGDITPGYDLVLYRSSGGGSVWQQFVNTTTGTTGTDGFLVGLDSSERAVIHNQENTDLMLYTNALFRGKIDAGGGWLIAPSGSNVTPNRALVIYDHTSGAVHTQWCNNTTGSGTTNGFLVGIDSAEDAVIWQYGAKDIQFATNATKRAYFDTTGGFVVGTPTGASNGVGTINVSTGLYVNNVAAVVSPQAGKVYSGHVDSAATAEVLPSGWTASNLGTGSFKVTHGLGLSPTTDLRIGISIAAGSAGSTVMIVAQNTNDFTYETSNSTPALADRAVTFVAHEV